jgi:tRNA(Ile)-lysidine synthase
MLAREFNPRLAAALADLADLMREEDALLDRLAGAAARGPTLSAPMLQEIEAPLARRAIRLWWRRHGSGRRLARTHIEALRQLAGRPSDDGEIAVPGGTVMRETGRLRFRSGAEQPGATAPWELPLVPGEDLATPGGWRLHLAASARAAAPAPSDDVCVVDADLVPGPFVVRNRRTGDRLQALGLAGHTSIKRLLSARHVPRHLRKDHPLLVTEAAVLWVPGCGRSDRGLVGPATERCWVIRVVRRPNESA